MPTCSVRWSGMLVSHSHLRSAVFAYRAAGVAWVTCQRKVFASEEIVLLL